MFRREISKLAAATQLQQTSGESKSDALVIWRVETQQLIAVLDGELMRSALPESLCKCKASAHVWAGLGDAPEFLVIASECRGTNQSAADVDSLEEELLRGIEITFGVGYQNVGIDTIRRYFKRLLRELQPHFCSFSVSRIV